MTTATNHTRPQLRRLGRYSITGRLGSGGMSRVYRAVADGTTHEVALKVTPLENDLDVTAIDYQREVMIGRRVRHPRMITAIDHGCRDGYLYLAMEVVDGATLSNATRLRDPSQKPASPRSSAYQDQWVVPMLDGQWQQILKIGVQLSEALVVCHSAGVIHRDIKPGNVLMDRQGDVYLMDFGLAWMRRGAADHVLNTKDGTARYLAPEVFRKRRDERSDVYSLGLTLHELATGRKPWGSIRNEDLKTRRPELRVPQALSVREDIPRELADCIDKAAADEPGERFQCAQDLHQTLLSLSRG